MESALIPLVLRARRFLPPESPPSLEMRFDEGLQLWMSRKSGRPVVLEYVRQSHEGGPSASNLGETVNTRTHEGVDQSERIHGSDLGETVITKTQEGIDTTESSWAE